MSLHALDSRYGGSLRQSGLVAEETFAVAKVDGFSEKIVDVALNRFRLAGFPPAGGSRFFRESPREVRDR